MFSNPGNRPQTPMEPHTTLPIPTLPLHLVLSLGCWLSSPFGWRCAKNASTPWSANLKRAAKRHENHIEKLERAVAQEASARASQLLEGIARYSALPARARAQMPCIWRSGNARLLDYGMGHCPPGSIRQVALFVPSLINRYYILDLAPERSLLRYLPAHGIYPLVLDWGTPGTLEQDFSCSDYIQRILLEAIAFVHRTAGQRIILAGYCMGGVLALAAAQLAQRHLAGLALFATPWDFHCASFKPFIADAPERALLEALLQQHGMLPPAVIQSLFYLTDPFIFEQKFRRFAAMPTGSAGAHDFMALEQWVNDGVPLTANVARDCLLGWAQDNVLARGQWRVEGRLINPGRLKLPIFMAIPKSDHVVPMECAAPLVDCLPQATLIHPSAGHVSMIVGEKAKKELWRPLIKWMNLIES